MDLLHPCSRHPHYHRYRGRRRRLAEQEVGDGDLRCTLSWDVLALFFLIGLGLMIQGSRLEVTPYMT